MSKMDYIKILEKNLSEETLKILAEKSKKPGIDAKVKLYQHLM